MVNTDQLSTWDSVVRGHLIWCQVMILNVLLVHNSVSVLSSETRESLIMLGYPSTEYYIMMEWSQVRCCCFCCWSRDFSDCCMSPHCPVTSDHHLWSGGQCRDTVSDCLGAQHSPGSSPASLPRCTWSSPGPRSLHWWPRPEQLIWRKIFQDDFYENIWYLFMKIFHIDS